MGKKRSPAKRIARLEQLLVKAGELVSQIRQHPKDVDWSEEMADSANKLIRDANQLKGNIAARKKEQDVQGT